MLNPVEELIRRDLKKRARLLFIGDSMTDVYVHGRLEETCQDNCPKFVGQSTVTVSGGSANAARSLSHWHVVSACPTHGLSGPVKTRFVVRPDNYRDVIVWRHDDDTVKFDQELARKECLRVLECYPFDGVLISDYDKGLLTPDFLAKVIWYCKQNNIPCVADAKREPDLYAGAIIKANRDWASKMWFRFAHWREWAVITYAFDPPLLFNDGYQGNFMKPMPYVPLVNHVGAGDCFAAHLILALAHRFSLKESAAIAHSAGRVYVQKPHNEPPRPEDIASDLARVV